MAHGKAKKDWVRVWRGYDMSCTVTGLHRGKWCCFRVRSINCDGMASPWSSVFDLKIKSAMRVDTGRRRNNKKLFGGKAAAGAPLPLTREVVVALSPRDVGVQDDNTQDKTWWEVYDQASGGWYFLNKEGATRKTLPDELVAEMVYA